MFDDVFEKRTKYPQTDKKKSFYGKNPNKSAFETSIQNMTKQFIPRRNLGNFVFALLLFFFLFGHGSHS